MVYDQVHNQSFVAVNSTNEVDVISATSGALVASIAVPSPFYLDLSADGSRLYVTSNVTILGAPDAEGFFVVDTSLLRVIDFVQPTIPGPFPNPNTSPRFIAAMSNGKIFYNADQFGVTSSSIFAYDPTTGISTPRPPTGGLFFYDGSISKSANGQRFVVLANDTAGTSLWVYDGTSDTYMASLRISDVLPDAIMSPDGTHVLAGGRFLYDQNLSQIADLTPGAPNNDFASYLGSAFSPDGSKIYIGNYFPFTGTTTGGSTFTSSNPVVAVFSTASHTLLGYIPAPQFMQSGFALGLVVSQQGMGLLTNVRGFAEMDLSNPNPNLSVGSMQQFPVISYVQPGVGSPANPAPAVVSGGSFVASPSVFFRGTPATGTSETSTSSISVHPPAEPRTGRPLHLFL